MKKGDVLESECSLFFHHRGVAVLVSPLVLRSLNLGQIDVAYLDRTSKKAWVLVIIESKSAFYPSILQLRRLRKTQDYLSRVLDMPAKLEVNFCQKDERTLSF
jgi:hypothetical protein